MNDKTKEFLRQRVDSERSRELTAQMWADDSEEFCDDCFAGMESSEHHEKCVVPREQWRCHWDDCPHGADCGHARPPVHS